MSAADAWLDALGRPDPSAWARVDEAIANLPAGDPVRVAIERESERGAAARARATPMLSWAAERARHEPFAFDRLVIEQAHLRSLGRPRESRAALDACVTLFERRVEQGGRTVPMQTARAVLALAVAYCAADERRQRRHIEAERELERAWSLLPEPMDPFQREIRATLVDVRIDLAYMSRDHRAAREHVITANRLLRDTKIPARRVVTWWRAGRTDVAIDRDARAVRWLEAAERELPVGLADHLRLDILHLLAFAEAARGRFQRASDCLDRAQPFLAEWAHEVLMAQREHLLGHLACIEERWSDAAEHWKTSVALALRVGYRADAMHTLSSLRPLQLHGVVSREEWIDLLRQATTMPYRLGNVSG